MTREVTKVTSIANDKQLRQTLDSLDIRQQRLAAVLFIKNVIYLNTDMQIQKAIDICYHYNILGKNILGSNFTYDLEIRLGAGAFVCGEETALIHSIEGERGQPRVRPPFPAQSGLRPTRPAACQQYRQLHPALECRLHQGFVHE